MRYLITGASGFIGTALKKRLSGEIFTPSRDVLLQGTKQYLEDTKPDIIFHLGGNSSGRSSLEEGFLSVVQAYRFARYKSKDCQLLFASSSMVYGQGTYSEEDCPRCNSAYGATKLACESYVNYADGISVRLTGVVGPSMTHGLMLDLINKFKYDDEIEIWNAYPGSYLQFIHIDDVISSFLALLDANKHDKNVSGPINISPCNVGTDVQTILRIISRELGISKSVKWLDKEPVRKCTLLNDLLREFIQLKYPSSEAAITAAVRSYV